MIETFNTGMAFLLATITGWAIMSHRVRDGIIVKIGLSFISIGFFGLFLIELEAGFDKSFAHALVYVSLIHI